MFPRYFKKLCDTLWDRAYLYADRPIVRLDNPQADLEGRRFELLQRADHFAIAIARTSPHCREDVLALAELVYDLAGTPVIRRAASHIVLGIRTLWT